MTEPSSTSLEEQDGLVMCAFGMVALMLALACVIALGVSALTVSSPIVLVGILFLILFALAGGYLVSKGLTLILRDSRRLGSTTQE